MQTLAISVGEQFYPILTLPGRPKAILDKTVAEIYRTETRLINRAVVRNQERFPSDFYFELTSEEVRLLKEIPNWNFFSDKGFAPKAFTAKGMNMLSTLLKSEVAIKRSVDIIRAFTELEKTWSRDDNWDIITAKIIAAINNRLDDVRISFDKRMTSIEDRIANIEQEYSIQTNEQRTNSNKIEELNDTLSTCVSKIEGDIQQIRNEFTKAIVDKSNYTVDKCINTSVTLKKASLTDRENEAISYIQIHGKITNREYRELFGVPRIRALRELNGLIDRCILKKQGKGRSVCYTML